MRINTKATGIKYKSTTKLSSLWTFFISTKHLIFLEFCDIIILETVQLEKIHRHLELRCQVEFVGQL